VIFNTHALRLCLWLQRFESLDVDGNGKLEMCDIVDDVERFNKSVAAAQEDDKPTFGAVLSSLGNIIAHGTADEEEDEDENTSSHAHRHPHDVSSNKSTLELGKSDADGVSASKDKTSSSSGSHPKQPHSQQSHSTNPFDLIRNLNIRFDDIFRRYTGRLWTESIIIIRTGTADCKSYRCLDASRKVIMLSQFVLLYQHAQCLL
jgi:hypothetical protein